MIDFVSFWRVESLEVWRLPLEVVNYHASKYYEAVLGKKKYRVKIKSPYYNLIYA